MSETLPTDFKHLKPTELYRAAIEDFALPVDEADKNKKNVLLAAFVEGGVSWADYVAQHPEVVPAAPAVVTSPTPVSSTSLTADVAPVEPTDKWADDDRRANLAVQEDLSPKVIVATQPQYRPQDKLLIKMERKNPMFQVRGYTFTQKNPYALMSPSDADHVLRNEEGFRQALPSEVDEWYD